MRPPPRNDLTNKVSISKYSVIIVEFINQNLNMYIKKITKMKN